MIRTPLLALLVTGLALAQTATQPTSVRTPPPVLPLPKALALARTTKITIDGSLADWPNLPPLLLDDPRQISGSQFEAWRGPRDLGAHVFLVWDGEDLYCGAAVSDDWHRELEEKSPRLTEIPSCDSIVLTFDPERDTRSLGADDGRKDDRELWLGSLRGGEQKLVLWDRYRGTARFAEGALAIARDQEHGVTTYECRIPWKEILPHGRKPERGLVFRLQAVVNDYDEPTDTMPQTRIGWTFGSFAERIDPGVLGSVMLVDTISESDRRWPEFPPDPQRTGDPVPGPAYWISLADRLVKHPPAPFGMSQGEASSIAGPERRSALEDLDYQISVFPRVDYVEYLERIDRRMRREVAGIAATGLPYLWQHMVEGIARELAKPAGDRPRLLRLPQGGVLVRGGGPTFAIDACGNDVDKLLSPPICDLLLQTDVYDIGRRNDQLLLRTMLAGKPVLMHSAPHLPGIPADKLRLTLPGKTVEFGGLKIKVLGTMTEQGLVSMKVGYWITWPDGTTLLVASPGLSEEHLPRAQKPDVMLLSAHHPRFQTFGQRVQAHMTVLDDVLVPPVAPGAASRVSVSGAYDLQEKLLPNRSILLAPGDSMVIAFGKPAR